MDSSGMAQPSINTRPVQEPQSGMGKEQGGAAVEEEPHLTQLALSTLPKAALTLTRRTWQAAVLCWPKS